MRIPELAKFSHHREFFKTFVQVNKENNPHFSYELFSRKTGWPKSLLPDLISNRKALSIRRALEFSAFAGLQTIEVEILLKWAAYSQTNDSKLGEFVDQIFSQEPKGIDAEENEEIKPFSKDPAVLAIISFLRKNKKLHSPQEILDFLISIDGLNETLISDTIEKLIEIEFLKVDEHKNITYIGEKITNVGLDENSAPGEDFRITHQGFARNLIRYCKDPVEGPGCIATYYIDLDQDKISELKQRVSNLLNYVNNLEGRNKADNADKSRLYQFDLNLFPVEK